KISGSRLFGITCALFFLASPVQAEEVVLPADDQLAMHQGRPHGGRYERHSLHHGMGRAGKGICPQSRPTAEAPQSLLTLKNPLEATRENIEEGENLYHYKASPTKCKVCHGPYGNGMGMMAQGAGPMPRNFTCKETMEQVSDGQMFWIIKNGSPGSQMPPYQLFLSDDQIWKLVLYIRTFTK
ncbi:MAG: c-type cytochrome, partial [Nitrospina sp.]|nr:c-type cytochrome [Nitrospina sp.]